MNRKILSALMLFLLLPASYNACSQSPFSRSDSGSSSDEVWTASAEENVTTNPYALLSAEQVLKSMSSVTNTPVNGAITNEYNSRQSSLASDFDLKEVTSPMLISITNLAGVVCNETLKIEMAQAQNSRRLFSSIDFSKSVNVITDKSYDDTVVRMSSAFWGRKPSSEESQVLSSGRGEFVSALSANEANNSSSSKNLMLFLCTSMLASFDSYSF